MLQYIKSFFVNKEGLLFNIFPHLFLYLFKIDEVPRSKTFVGAIKAKSFNERLDEFINDLKEKKFKERLDKIDEEISNIENKLSDLNYMSNLKDDNKVSINSDDDINFSDYDIHNKNIIEIIKEDNKILEKWKIGEAKPFEYEELKEVLLEINDVH